MRIAILADIHGNLPALAAVHADLQRQAPDAVYLAGDQINRCPWNNEVIDLMRDEGWPAIAGNHEWVVARLGTPENRPPFTNRARFPDLWWTREHLTAAHLATIRTLPASRLLAFPGTTPIRLIHGLPDNPFVGILPETPEPEVAAALAGVAEPVVVCGHTHRPMARRCGRWYVVNGGSVGMPYNGDPRAQYLLLDWAQGRWHPTFRQVAYPLSAVTEGFARYRLEEAWGALARLYLRTILTGQPWASDFGQWMKEQPEQLQQDLDRAVALYLARHGPDRWAFG